MRKGKSVIGKQILSLSTGQRLETVNDLVLDPDGRRMIALVVSEGGHPDEREGGALVRDHELRQGRRGRARAGRDHLGERSA